MHLPVNISSLLQQTVVESERIEFKANWNPEPILKTLCAFANDFQNLGGGYIVIGVEEENGVPLLPPKGVTKNDVDSIQKEITRITSFIRPVYNPLVSIDEIEGKLVVLIWAPGGQARPYSAPRVMTKLSDHCYFVRKNSSTVMAKHEELRELLSLTSNIPFDDRMHQQSVIQDLKLPLIQSFLKNINSELFDASGNMPFEHLCRQLLIVDGGKEILRPRNVGLLFFNDQPEQFFPYAQIEVVYFPDGEGGDVIQEEVFKGPLDQQLRDALRHIRNNFISERVLKFPDRAEADRFYNYPFSAIEEALVNAIYHRSYEIREPIEVRITPEAFTIVSHPGADPSIPIKDVERGKMITRRYRNRRIGEFLKELDFTEGRGTGIPKMQRALLNNGSPEAAFYTDDGRLSFHTKISIHPAFRADEKVGVHDGAHDRVHGGVHDFEQQPLSETRLSILKVLQQQPMSTQEIAKSLGYQTRTRNVRDAIQALFKAGYIAYTIPDKPKSKLQKYQIKQPAAFQEGEKVGVHDRGHDGAHDRVHGGVHDFEQQPLSETRLSILKVLQQQPMGTQEIAKSLGYQTRTRNVRDAIQALFEAGYIAYTIPDKPKSKLQKYQIQQSGLAVLKGLNK